MLVQVLLLFADGLSANQWKFFWQVLLKYLNIISNACKLNINTETLYDKLIKKKTDLKVFLKYSIKLSDKDPICRNFIQEKEV